MEYDQYWYWLNNIVGVGRQTIRYLLKIYGNPQAVYEADVHKAAEQINDERGRLAFLQSKDPVRILEEWNRLKEKNTFSRYDAPVLYMAGFCDWFENERRFVIMTTAANESIKT